MKDLLADDWNAIKARGRRPRRKTAEEPEGLHEDWAAVKGGKYPPYGYIVEWRYTSVCVIYKMLITGKSRCREGVFYMARYAGVFFKSPGSGSYALPKPEQGEPYTRNELCFTAEEVEKRIEGLRRYHISKVMQEMAQLRELLERTHKQMEHFASYLNDVRGDPIPAQGDGEAPEEAEQESGGA